MNINGMGQTNSHNNTDLAITELDRIEAPIIGELCVAAVAFINGWAAAKTIFG